MKGFITSQKLWWLVSLKLALLSGFGFVLLQPEEVKSPPPVSDFLLAEYYFNHGTYADGTYDLKLAREYYERALTENPMGDSIAWYQLGRIDFLEGRFEDALYKFDKQVEYFEYEQPNVLYMIALTYGYRARIYNRSADWEKAEENFLHYLEFDTASPWARTDLAWVYFAQGKYEEMLEPLQVGLNENPNNAWLLNMYGLALLNTEEKDQAREYFERARESAALLTTEEWGSSYPGNDPNAWSRGLKEFRAAIDKNLELAS